jgi:hypothetical protein
MKRLRSILIVVAIFVSGMVVGGIGAGTAAMNEFVKGTFRDPVSGRRLLVKYAKHHLSLDEDQAHQFWQIINDSGSDLHKATEPVRPQIDEVVNKAELRMRAVLREHQRPQFDAFMKTARTRWQAAMTGIEPTAVKVEEEKP